MHCLKFQNFKCLTQSFQLACQLVTIVVIYLVKYPNSQNEDQEGQNTIFALQYIYCRTCFFLIFIIYILFFHTFSVPRHPGKAFPDSEDVAGGTTVPPSDFEVPQSSVAPFWIPLRSGPFLFPTKSPWFIIPGKRNIIGLELVLSQTSTAIENYSTSNKTYKV